MQNIKKTEHSRSSLSRSSSSRSTLSTSSLSRSLFSRSSFSRSTFSWSLFSRMSFSSLLFSISGHHSRLGNVGLFSFFRSLFLDTQNVHRFLHRGKPLPIHFLTRNV